MKLLQLKILLLTIKERSVFFPLNFQRDGEYEPVSVYLFECSCVYQFVFMSVSVRVCWL